MQHITDLEAHLHEVQRWAVSFLLDDCVAVVIGEVVLNLVSNFVGNVHMMEQLKDCLCLIDLNAEKLTAGIDALWRKSRVQRILNLGAVRLFNSASELTYKWHGDAGCIQFFQSLVNILLGSHTNLDQPRHNGVGHKIDDAVFYWFLLSHIDSIYAAVITLWRVRMWLATLVTGYDKFTLILTNKLILQCYLFSQIL